MSASRKIGAARAVWLQARVGALRWRNRIAAGMRRKRTPAREGAARSESASASDTAHTAGTTSTMSAAGATPIAAEGSPRKRERGATGRKHSLGLVGLVALGLFMLLASSFQATAAVRKVQAEGQDILFLPARTYRCVRMYAPVLGPDSSSPADKQRESRSQMRKVLEQRLSSERATLTDEERAQMIDWIVERVEAGGLAAFAPDIPAPFVTDTDVPWSRGDDDPQVPMRIRRMGWLLALCGIVGLLSTLGGSVQDLGKVDWSLEWLSSLPLSQRALFWGRFAEQVIVSPMNWFVTLPVAWAVFVLRGWTWAALPLALFVAIWVAALVAALALALETTLRMRSANLKNVQAALTVCGSLLFVCLLWLSNAPELPRWFEFLARVVPADVTLFGHVAHMLASPSAALFALPLLALEAAVCSWLAVSWCAYLTRRGLSIAPGTNQGERGRARARSADAPAWLRGALRKDLLLLVRDRAFLAQTLIVPLLVVAVQIVLNRQLLQLLASTTNHAAAFAFGLGAYMLVFSAALVLSVEGNALWILLTAPQPLDRVLRSKATLWAIVGTVYTLGGIAIVLWIGRMPDARGWISFATAIVGIPIYAFLAAGLGALATDPLEPDVRRRVAHSTLWMYMLLVAMYASAIYTDLLYVKLVQVVLSALLAYALWQRVSDRIPYLLDPTDAPPPQLGLSDGLLAALAFLALQTLFYFLFASGGHTLGVQMLLSFVVAGACTASASLYLLKRQGIPALWRTLGIARSIPGALATWKSVLLGAGVGGIASLCAVAYLHFLSQHPELMKHLLPETDELEFFKRERVAFALLAIVGAPFVEEYLFRGLVFRGMQRSIGTAWAVIGSAAVFAMVHPAISALPVFVLGVAAALVFQRGGRLWGAVACHLTYNAVVVWMQFAAQDAQ